MTPMDVLNAYYRACSTGDMDFLAGLFTEHVIVHTGYTSPPMLHGRTDAVRFIAQAVEATNGSLRIVPDHTLGSRQMAAAVTRITARRAGRSPLDVMGIDVARIPGAQIDEMWWFSSDPAVEEGFWS